jgi:hypothetical protein
MKYQLSKAVIEQLSSNILEIIPNKGIIVDKNYLDECWNFYDEQQKEPFGLLINLKNQHSCSFEGSQYTGRHPLIKKTAFLRKEDDDYSKKHLNKILQVKEMVGHFWNHEIFYDRKKAIEWLSDV